MKYHKEPLICKSARSLHHTRSKTDMLLETDRKKAFDKLSFAKDISHIRDHRRHFKFQGNFNLPSKIQDIIEAGALDSHLLPNLQTVHIGEENPVFSQHVPSELKMSNFHSSKNSSGRQDAENLRVWLSNTSRMYLQKADLELTKAIVVVAVKEIIRQISVESTVRGNLLWEILKMYFDVWDLHIEELKNRIRHEKSETSKTVANLKVLYARENELNQKKVREINDKNNELNTQITDLQETIAEINKEIEIKDMMYKKLLDAEVTSGRFGRRELLSLDSLAYLEKNVRVNYSIYKELEAKIELAKLTLASLESEKMSILVDTTENLKIHPAEKLCRALTVRNLSFGDLKSNISLECLLKSIRKIYSRFEDHYKEKGNGDLCVFVYENFAVHDQKFIKEKKFKAFISACVKNTALRRISLFLRFMGLGHLTDSQNFSRHTLMLYLNCLNKLLEGVDHDLMNPSLETPMIELSKAIDCVRALPSNLPKETLIENINSDRVHIEAEYVLEIICESHAKIITEIEETKIT